jgi:hypothetical protein
MEMTNQDAYWGAKIVMSFTPDDIRAIVKKGEYSDPAVEKYIADVLIERRDKIGRYWFSKVNPLDRFAIEQKDGATALRFDDLGVESGLWPTGKHHYELRHYKSKKVVDSGVLTEATHIPISADLLASMADLASGKASDDQERFFYYQLKTERDGKLSKATRVYLYYDDANAARLKIVRIEREG